MKKLLTLSAILLTVMGAEANPITRAKALRIAQEYLVPGHAMSIKAEAKTRRASASQTAPYYIISRGENQGFVIVSGDDCLPAILGYTDSGDYDENDVPPAFQEWMDARAAMIEYAQENGLNTPYDADAAARHRAAANRVDVPYLIQTLWKQDGPYNAKCPINKENGSRAIVGCVATAASQIIYYWRREANPTLGYDTPTYGYGGAPATEEFQIKGGTPILFDFMTESYSGSEPAIYKESVATLCAAVGMSAWLTYWTDSGETSGQIDNCRQVFSGQFGLNGGTFVTKRWGGYSNSSWEDLIYNQLIQGRPVLYSGTKGSSGHAVVCDGYKANTGLFHINFGWGSGYNGYYTLDDNVQGWGFNESNDDGATQSCVYDIYPRSVKAEVSINLPKVVYSNATNEVEVKVENCGTLPFSGVYLFASTSSVKPSVLSSAVSSDTKTVFERDKEQGIKLTFKPNSEREWYLTLTDAKCNILAQKKVVPVTAVRDIHFQRIWIDGSPEQEAVGDETFQVVYNSKPVMRAQFFNASSVSFDTSTQLEVFTYDVNSKEWTEMGAKTVRMSFDGESAFTLNSTISSTSRYKIEEGHYYMLKMPKLLADGTSMDMTEAPDSMVRFVIRAGDMEQVGDFADGCLTLKGHFDRTTFESTSFAGKTAYRKATAYDLTQCEEVGYVEPLSVSPNALFYVSDDSKATGVNVVRAGQCEQLVLVPGNDFKPRADFVAAKAQIVFGTEPGRWYLLTSPFDAKVPNGIIARSITSHLGGNIVNNTTDVHELEAGKTYMLMGTSAGNMTLTGENVSVVANPVENADAAVVGTYVKVTTPVNSRLLEDEEGLSFVTVSEGTAVEALRGYLCADDLSVTFSANSNTRFDPAYLTLAESIRDAYMQLATYKDITTEDAYNTYLEKIKDAEKEFSYRAKDETTLTTLSKVKAYAAQLVADGAAYMRSVGDVGYAEIDYTDVITNPSFEASPAISGWKVSTSTGRTGGLYEIFNGTQADVNRTVGLDGVKVFQSLMSNADSNIRLSASVSQTLTGLAPGYYRLSAMVGTDADSTVTLFAGDSTVTVSGHAFGGAYLTKAVVDQVKVVADQGSDTGSLTIGVKEGAWYRVDDFRLAYVSSFADEDDPTAITTISDNTKKLAKKGIYTLQGVKVKEITAPGTYIIDGKKVVK